MAKAARLVLVPVPEVGHLKPTVEMAKRLSSRFSITILVMHPLTDAWSPTMKSISTSAASTAIQFVELPPVKFSSDDGEDATSIFSRFIESQKSVVKDAITTHPSSLPIAAIIIDFFCTAMIDIAAEIGIPPYIYFTASAATLGLMLYLPTIDLTYPLEMENLASKGEMIKIPCLAFPLPPLAMPEPVLNKKRDGYKWFLHHARRFQEVKGIVINTFTELEPNAINAIFEGRCVPDHPTPAIYPVGPVLSVGKQEGHECIEWLDGQPQGSVVFLCFGSRGFFNKEQVMEIAAGLERSRHRFLWCLRSPPEGKYEPPRDADLGAMLPEGFLERAKGRGMVWPRWAPQAEILGHKAVGGFASHCGWNSCLESLCAGVPMLGWPLYAEQRFNAFEMTREVRVATEIRVGDGGMVGAEEVERGVRCLMGEDVEGRKVRERAREVKELGRRAREEGGSSRLALEALVKEFIKEIELVSN
ncbi:anthocyanidin 3-O-glucosyltransferase 2 [Cocos nucifera]|uniref:Anthocyanidin 3-O-glucosyltransferase 2 n=1 Tax=Cocos nucifera TaxID=13894 RepID=A0A8K0HVC6_COCNU|nr:anthocyanidin 3-O-glucosyltransferase 2 [Cocos nucifera]